MPGYIIFKCNNCGNYFDMDADDPRQYDPHCPKCGSTNVEIVKVEP